MPIDITDDKPIVSELFKKAMEAKRINNTLSGVDICDVPECYCKTLGGEESTLSLSRCQTPQLTESGSVTPKESGSVTPKGTYLYLHEYYHISSMKALLPAAQI